MSKLPLSFEHHTKIFLYFVTQSDTSKLFLQYYLLLKFSFSYVGLVSAIINVFY